MTSYYGMIRLESPDDWNRVIDKWKPGHSAFELAHKWQVARGFPENVKAVLKTTNEALLARLIPELCIVEQPVWLDTLKAPSMTDIMVYCRNDFGERVVMAVEGKALEHFDRPVANWVRNMPEGKPATGQPVDSRLDRLAFLSEVLRLKVDGNSTLRYQLLHRSASAILKAEEIGAVAAVMLVHSFADEDTNTKDYEAFLLSMGILRPRKDVIFGPKACGRRAEGSGIPTFFCWVSDDVSGASGKDELG